jgi:hypothetical protein
MMTYNGLNTPYNYEVVVGIFRRFINHILAFTKDEKLNPLIIALVNP